MIKTWETTKTPKSSRISEISFMGTKKTNGQEIGHLRVVFPYRRKGINGLQYLCYEYINVPREVYVSLCLADSVGKKFDELVKDKYSYKKL